MKCGNCKKDHATVQEVKSCYAGQKVEPSVQVATFNPPTEKQMKFIHSLLHEREVPPAGKTDQDARMIARAEDVMGQKPISRREASDLISWLLDQPKISDPGKQSADGDPAGYGDPVRKVYDYTTPNSGIPDVPAGHYAVPDPTGHNDLRFYRVDKPTNGRWAGRTFVKQVVGGHPRYPVRGKAAQEALEAIQAAGPAEAAVLYGQELGRCYAEGCNRELTDELSRKLSIGPVCRAKGKAF